MGFGIPFRIQPDTLNGYPVGNTGNIAVSSLVLNDITSIAPLAVINITGDDDLIADGTGIAGLGVNVTSVESLIFNTKFAIEGAIKLKAVEPLILLQTGLPGLGGIGGVIDIFDDEVLVKANVQELNFKNLGVLVLESATFRNGADIHIPPPDFAITSFTVSPSLFEAGTIIGFFTLTWTYEPDDIVSQIITGRGIIDQPLLTDRSKDADFFVGIVDNESWTLDSIDLFGNTAQATVNMRVGALLFFGKRPEPTIGENEIDALSDSSLETGKTSPFTFITTTTPEFLYIAYPAVWGDIDSFIDTTSGFPFPMQKQVPDVSVTNSNFYNTDYTVFRSVNQTAGEFTIAIAPTGAENPLDPPNEVPSDSLATDPGGPDFLVVSGVDSLSTGDPYIIY